MLILFDIDGTLLTTSGVGIHAMGAAGRRLYSADFDEHCVEYAGRLDPLIITDLLIKHDQEPTPEAIERFRHAYGSELEALLHTPGIAQPCPGVVELIDTLEQIESLTLGLLTGNYPETGRRKLSACGLDPDRFPIAAWGCDSPHNPGAREHLPPVAIDRFHRTGARRIGPEQVVIIGDTPHDIACGRAHACRTIGVAT
ncbi:MAG: hypothetical protein EA380_07480, partial [Phycisphaeraceae bacterium]